MGCNRSYCKDETVLVCRDQARNANALGTFPAAQKTEGFAGASGRRDSAQLELQQHPQLCATAHPACQHTWHTPPRGKHLRAGGSLGPAARAGKGGDITRKTSMHERAVAALRRMDSITGYISWVFLTSSL